MSGERVLIDTSVWIGYFRGRDARLAEKVDEVLAHSEVFVPKVVIAELMRGAKSDKEIAVIEEFTGAFNVMDQTGDTWPSAGRLSYSMKKKGVTAHLVDCYIAVMASEHGCKIFTLDEHFKGISRFLALELL